MADEIPGVEIPPAAPEEPAAPAPVLEPVPERPTTVLRLACGDTVLTDSPCATAHYCATHGLTAVVDRAEFRKED